MRGKAARSRKYIPSLEELEHMLAYNPDMLCYTCGKKMVWHCSFSKLGDVMSLQHETDGTISFICHSCNAAHGPMGDKFYNKQQLDMQYRLAVK